MDVTIRHPRAQKYLRRAASTDGAAATEAEGAKRQRYPAVAEAGLPAVTPFALESFGRFGTSAYRLLHEARQRAAERDAGLRDWAGSKLMSRWLALLSCSLQRSLYHAAQAMWGYAGVDAAELRHRVLDE